LDAPEVAPGELLAADALCADGLLRIGDAQFNDRQ
jgi:hypothetical protein